jgi:hypothetical protein
MQAATSSLQRGCVKFCGRSSRDASRVYDAVAEVIQTHEHADDFKKPSAFPLENKKPWGERDRLIASVG